MISFPARFLFNFSDIKTIKSNLFALNTNKSFCYLTKNDFIKAFGTDRTVVIAKDYKSIRFNFEVESGGTSSLLLNNYKETELRDVHVIGDVVKPTQLKLFNSIPVKSIPDPELLFCLDEMASDDEEADATMKSPDVKKFSSRAQNLTLYRRRLKYKKFIDLDEDEQEKLATSTLNFNKYKNKSMFHVINEKKLVHPSDYEEPDFISLTEPPDADYEPNYSSSPPSVHDLFDIDIQIEAKAEDGFEPVEYEMMEYLDEVEALWRLFSLDVNKRFM